RSLYLVTIPDRWTPEQPLAVVEFIGDSRQAVGALYAWRPSPWWPRASSTYRCRLSPTILCAVRFHKYVASNKQLNLPVSEGARLAAPQGNPPDCMVRTDQGDG